MKISSPWQIFKTALRDYRTGLVPYLKILAIVALPVNLIALVPGLSTVDAAGNVSDPFGAFTPFATFIMNVALVWAITRRPRNDGKVPTVAAAYYDGSSVIVRYALVGCALVIMLIPAAFGVLIFSVGVIGASAVGVSVLEQVLVGGVAVLLALPSIYMIIRNGFAPYVAVHDDLRPMASLRRSRELVAGRFWRVMGRLLALAFFGILVSVPAILVTIGLALLQVEAIAVVFFEIASTLIVLPLANLYLFHLYRELEQTAVATNPVAAKAKEAEAPILEEAPA